MTLHHYTVQTGHLTLQTRGEVDQYALDLLAPMILKPGTHALPGTTIKLDIPDGNMGQTSGVGSFRLLAADGEPVALAMLAWRASAEAGVIWGTCLPNTPMPAAPAGYPWLAIVLMPGITALSRDDIMMLGDIERCVAWSIITQQPAG
jgi:hypothetical protein